MKKDIVVGDVFKTNNSGLVTVLEDKGLGIFTIKFIDTGAVRDTRRQQLLSGSVKDKAQVKPRGVSKEYKVTLRNGECLFVHKLIHAIEFLEDKDVTKLYSISKGYNVKNHEVESIEKVRF